MTDTSAIGPKELIHVVLCDLRTFRLKKSLLLSLSPSLSLLSPVSVGGAVLVGFSDSWMSGQRTFNTGSLFAIGGAVL